MRTIMKKRSYKTPETLVYQLDTESSILLSVSSGTNADKDATVLINEEEFIDIWDQ